MLETLVAEVYGPAQERQLEIARQVRDLFKKTDGVVDVDWYVEDDRPKVQLHVDEEKAALHGITDEQVARTLSIASAGAEAACCTLIRKRKTSRSRCG